MASPTDSAAHHHPLPPLPPGPPPPNAQHAYYANQFVQWDGIQGYGCPVTAFDAQAVPQITQMLYREGEAWRALLALHSGVVSTAQQISAVVTESATLDTNETGNATEHRELQYCAALTQVASHCDALHAEAIKLRGLRKARASADVQTIQALMDAHTNETLAVGSSLASGMSMSIQSATADVRTAIQSTRTQLSQTRALLELVHEAPALRGRLRIGIVDDTRNTTLNYSTDAVFAAVYRINAELTEEALVQAMEVLSAEDSSEAGVATGPVEDTVASPPQRTVARRTGDRTPLHR